MYRRFTRFFTVFTVSAVIAGCSHSAPIASVPPPSAPVAAPEPPAQPSQPKCDSLDDACTVTSDFRMQVGQSEWTIAPPNGWRFAHASAETMAASPGAVIAVTTYDKHDTSRSRETVMRELSGRLGLTLPARRDLFPKKPHKRQAVAGIMLSLYQFGGVRRSEHRGVVLVFTTDMPSDAAILGVAFVADDDRSNGDQAIVRTIGSLALPEAAAPAPAPPRMSAAKLSNSPKTEIPAHAPDVRRSAASKGTEKQNYGALDLH